MITSSTPCFVSTTAGAINLRYVIRVEEDSTEAKDGSRRWHRIFYQAGLNVETAFITPETLDRILGS